MLTIEQCEALDERLQAPQLTVAFGVAQKWRKSSLR
ncbi:hypothetical protein S7335_803 [Synechococcus sp. PCC 7335]|nr:hypothetical protein S7335_803 [Synechococcus sp. PCC 7335]